MRDEKGFTMVELLVVFALLFIGTTAGIAAFSSFNNSQVLDSSTSNVVASLNAAKAKAVAQIFPSGCTQLLSNYRVSITTATGIYRIHSLCSGVDFVLEVKKLPNGVNFDPASSTEVSFVVGSGESTGGTIKVRDSNKTNTIQVNTSGEIKII